MLFSFVGTVLGGIWADQSWGRFWGWDPKENGAVLIVLWNALILHARWGGLVRERGIACLAIFGNIVTAWSWFGTNMLGVGLHTYGFMDSAVTWLAIFVFAQFGLILLGNLPLRFWWSLKPSGPQGPVSSPACCAPSPSHRHRRDPRHDTPPRRRCLSGTREDPDSADGESFRILPIPLPTEKFSKSA